MSVYLLSNPYLRIEYRNIRVTARIETCSEPCQTSNLKYGPVCRHVLRN